MQAEIPPVEAELAAFLAGQEAAAEETAVWGGAPLRIRTYLGARLPPKSTITSVRAVLLRGETVMTLQNGDETWHVTPGGRCEPGETLLDTLHREVLEETGWTLARPALLGFIHYHHLKVQPPDFPYPYPDFTQPVYVAEAVRFLPAARSDNEYEVEVGFRPWADAQSLPLDDGQCVLLMAALARRSNLQVRPERS